jgi:hypothetical protein
MKKILLTTLSALSISTFTTLFAGTTVPYSCPSGAVIQANVSQTVAEYLAQCPDTTPVLKPAVVISRYQGTKVASDSNEGIVQVNIPTSAEGKTLVLAGYENINWIISNPNNVNVVKIIATNGEYSGTIRVTGAISGIQVETHKAVPYPSATSLIQGTSEFSDWLKAKGLSVALEDFNGGGANTEEQVVVPINAEVPSPGERPSAEIRIKSTQYEVPFNADTVFEGEPIRVTVKGRNATHCTLSSKNGAISIQPNGPYTKYEGINYTYTVASASQTADYISSTVTGPGGYVHYYAKFTAICYNQNIASTPVSYSVEVARAALTPKEPTCPAGQRYDSNEYAKYGTNTCKPGKSFTCADGTVITVHNYSWSNESTYYFQCPVPPVLDKGVLIQTAPTFASSTDKTERVGKTNITIPRQAEGKALILQTTGMITTDGTGRYHINNFIVSNPNNVKIKRIIIVENLCGDCGFDDGIIPTTVSGDISGIKVERWLGDAGVGGASEPKGKMFQYLRTDRLKYIPGLENEKYLDLRIRGISIDPLDVYIASEACQLPYVVANNPTPCAPTVYHDWSSPSSYAPPKSTTTLTVVGKYQSGTYGFKMSANFTEDSNPQVDNNAVNGQTYTKYISSGQPFKVNFKVTLGKTNLKKGFCSIEKDGTEVAKYESTKTQGENLKSFYEYIGNSYTSTPLNTKTIFKVYCERSELFAKDVSEMKSGVWTKEVKSSRFIVVTVQMDETVALPPSAVYKVTYNGEYGRETKPLTNRNLTRDQAVARCSSDVSSINSFTALNSKKPDPICTWGTEQIYPLKNSTAVTITNECTMTSVNWPNCQGVGESHSVGVAGVGVSDMSSFPSGCTSSTTYSPTTGERCVATNNQVSNGTASTPQYQAPSAQNVAQNTTPSTTKKPYRQFYGSLIQQSRRSVTREEAVRLCNTRISATQSRKDRGLKKYTDVTKIKCTWGDEQIYPAPATGAVSTETQSLPQVLGISTSSLCLDAPRNMHRGHNEPREVLRLQSFLAEKGFLEEDNVTGFYGDKTIEAVKDYQASVGLPVTGMTYSLTREAMRMESCR